MRLRRANVVRFVLLCGALACSSPSSSGPASNTGSGTTTVGSSTTSVGTTSDSVTTTGAGTGGGSGTGGAGGAGPDAGLPNVDVGEGIIGVGLNHACLLNENGSVTCWGGDGQGQATPPTGSFSRICAGYEFSCGLRSADGVAQCWGANAFGQSSPPSAALAKLSCGQTHACGITKAGEATCWGSYYRDDKSVGTRTGTYLDITAGGTQTCAIKEGGAVECWRGNTANQAPVGAFAKLAAKYDTVCGIRVDGKLLCWTDFIGDPWPGSFAWVAEGSRFACAIDERGELQCDGEATSSFPLPESPLPAFAVDMDLDSACAVRRNGTVVCWGSRTPKGAPSDRKGLGNGDATTGGPASPILTAGGDMTCVVKRNGTLACWGLQVIRPPTGLFLSASLSGQGLQCGIKTNGRAVCWNDGGLPASYPPLGSYTQIAAGTNGGCGVTKDGAAVCWDLRLDSTIAQPTGVQFAEVAVGDTQACGIATDGKLYCWGNDLIHLQAGIIKTPVRSLSVWGNRTCAVGSDDKASCWDDTTLTPSGPDGAFSAVRAGPDYACAIRKTDQGIVCWGKDVEGRTMPPAGAFTTIAVGAAHGCGIRQDGTITCWGRDQGVAPSLD